MGACRPHLPLLTRVLALGWWGWRKGGGQGPAVKATVLLPAHYRCDGLAQPCSCRVFAVPKHQPPFYRCGMHLAAACCRRRAHAFARSCRPSLSRAAALLGSAVAGHPALSPPGPRHACGQCPRAAPRQASRCKGQQLHGSVLERGAFEGAGAGKEGVLQPPECKQSSAKLPLLPPVRLPPHNGRSVCLRLPPRGLRLHGQALYPF